MEGLEIKFKILCLLCVCFLQAEDLDTLSFEKNSTMELIKAYVDYNASSKTQKGELKPKKNDYEACKEQLANSFLNLSGVKSLAIDKHYALSFSSVKPFSYQVYDPFFDFYVIKSEEKLPFAKRADENTCAKGSDLAVINQKQLKFGKLVSKGQTNTYNFTFSKGGIVINPCCQMLGVSLGEDRYLPLKYLDYIKKRTTPFNGYIGANFYQGNEGVYVQEVDPFLKNLPFCPNDKILSVNEYDIRSKKQLRSIILSAKVGSKLDILIQRGDEHKRILVEVFEKPKYKLSASAFLRNLGLDLNQDLSIASVKKDTFAQKSGLKIGDRLLQIDFKDVKSLQDVKNAIISNKEVLNLLFTRHDFQFFVKFDRKDVKGAIFALSHCPAI